jgi:protein TonB
MDAVHEFSGYGLKSELARFCLPAAHRDANRNLAWTNSICLLFLLIGLAGIRPGVVPIKPVPPVDEVIPTVIEPVIPPAQTTTQDLDQNQDQNNDSSADTPQVVVVTPAAPNINFAVPTVGNLVAPAALAQAPPLRSLQPMVLAKPQPTVLNSTGVGGERPQPPYPKIALAEGQQGAVTLLFRVNEAGVILDIEVKESSGFTLLDRSSVEFVRSHWTIPPGAGSRWFQTTIRYRLQAG